MGTGDAERRGGTVCSVQEESAAVTRGRTVHRVHGRSDTGFRRAPCGGDGARGTGFSGG